MKLSLNKTITTGALLLGFGVAASAQNTLVAGWDFSQYSSPGGFSSTDGANLTGSLNANYTRFAVDDGTGFIDDQGPNFVGAAQFGTMHYDGQFGSTAFSLNPSDLRPNGDVDMSVGASVGGTTLGSNGNRGVLGDQGQQFTNAYSLGFNESANGKSFVFAISLTANGSFQQGNDWVFQFGGVVASTDTDGSAINWETSTDGATYGAAGTTNLTDSETLYSVDLTGFDGASDIFLRGTFSGIDEAAYIDNVSASAAVPEPSAYAAIFGILALGFAAFRRRLSK